MASIHLLLPLLASFITLQPGSTLELSEFRMLESPYGEGVMRSGRLSELARAARSGNMIDPLIRFGKRAMDGAPLIRFGRREMDGAPLIRFGKRGMDGAPLIRFGKRAIDGAPSPLVRFGKRPMDGAPLIRFGKRATVERRRMEDGDVMLRFGR